MGQEMSTYGMPGAHFNELPGGGSITYRRALERLDKHAGTLSWDSPTIVVEVFNSILRVKLALNALASVEGTRPASYFCPHVESAGRLMTTYKPWA